ncbi:hypothetical protein QOT17_003414 [Balamuthia mandrillaris]
MSLLSLPVELLGLIMEHIRTSELYPNCFLVCKTLLEAVQQDEVWKRRCLRDLDLSEQDLFHASATTPCSSWQQVYKEHSDLFQWDPHHATLSASARNELVSSLGLHKQHFYEGEGCTANDVTILEDPSLNYEEEEKKTDEQEPSNCMLRINKRLVRWEGLHSYVSVRTKRPIRGARCVSLEFVIWDFTKTHNFGVGFITDNWDCRLNLHPNGIPKHSGWLWWNDEYCSHSICGEGTVPQTRHVKIGWEEGDVLGATVDLLPRTSDRPFSRAIHFFKNGEWAESISLPADAECLWPAVKMYDSGDMVEVRGAPMAFTLPPEKYPDIEAQLRATETA